MFALLGVVFTAVAAASIFRAREDERGPALATASDAAPEDASDDAH